MKIISSSKRKISKIHLGEEEDYEFNTILEHKWENGILVFTVELTSGVQFQISFHILKNDHPIEAAKYIINHDIEESSYGKYITWAKNIIKSINRTM